MYTPADVRKIEAERDELFEAASSARNILVDLPRGGKHIRCAGCEEDIFQVIQWLDKAIDKAEGRK